MKTITINKTKVKVFEEQELREKLKMSDDNIKIVLEYQRIFPELLQDGLEGFVIDGEILCKELDVKDNYMTWLLRETKGKEGKLIKYKCIENVDFISDWNFPNANFTREEVENMSPQQRSSYKIKNKIMLTLECAKKIGMRQNNDKGDLICNYFILMEKTLRNYEEWINVRNPEKKNANILKSKIGEFASRNLECYDLKGLCAREFNLINKSLLGCTALEIKLKLDYLDKQTREHLTTEINKAINYLQEFDINLLECDVKFDTRKMMIQNICNSKYSSLKEEFNK